MNHITQAAKARFLRLCEQSHDQPLSQSEASELNSLLSTHPELVRLMAESLIIDAEIRRDPRLLAEMKITPAETSAPRNIIALVLLAAAACVFLGLLIFQVVSRPSLPSPPAGVAILSKSTNCKWASSTIPTAEGSHVPAGRLELVEGLATILFDSGAEITLEAPATLEILDKMNARLVSGTLVANVPEQATGFTIDTKDAKVVDIGTRFGLSTDEDGKYLVHVIEGLVEVEHKGEPGVKKITTGNSIDRGLLEMKKNPVQAAAEPTRWQPLQTTAQADGWHAIPTSYGKGKDSFVTSEALAGPHGSDPFFRVKYSSIQPKLVRVGYIGFDIGRISKQSLIAAELILNIEPSELGFVTLVPDSTFTIYGLTDETEDGWSESEMRWETAPALDPEFAERTRPDPAKAVPLGTFRIEQGIQSGVRSISGPALSGFLRNDTNGIATFIVFRETDESSKSGLVHAFTSKESSSNPPPLLRVKTE